MNPSKMDIPTPLSSFSDADLVEEIKRRGNNLLTDRNIIVGGFTSGPGLYSLLYNGPNTTREVLP